MDNAPTKVISDQDAFEWTNPSNKFIVFEKPNVTGSAVGYDPNQFLDRLNYKGNYEMPIVENEFLDLIKIEEMCKITELSELELYVNDTNNNNTKVVRQLYRIRTAR